MKELISNEVLTETAGLVRFKYDIFEDICFERFIDSCFDKSKSNCNSFFSELNNLGKCAFRRYQIWLDNKLLSKASRKRFIQTILFSSNLPEEWRNETMVGLIKSKHGDSFFDECSSMISGDTSLINDLVDKTNLYGFEINKYDKNNNFTRLKPSGSGRENLIKIIGAEQLYKGASNIESIVKMCVDYSLSPYKKENISKISSDILCYYLDTVIDDYVISSLIKQSELDDITKTLKSLYVFCDYSEDWLHDFFNKMKGYFVSSNHNCQKIAETVFKNLFTTSSILYSLKNQEEFYSLYEFYYTVKRDDYDQFENLYRRNDTKEFEWGLNDNAEEYEHTFFDIDRLPFYILFSQKPFCGAKWLVSFLNKLVINLNIYKRQEKWKVTFFDNITKTKEYYGSLEMWLSSCCEYMIPSVLSDIVCSFKMGLKQFLSEISDSTKRIKCANSIRDYIYNESNNVILLSVLSEIGLFFLKELPGYAIDLASNIDIVMSDIDRLVFDMQNNGNNPIRDGITSMLGIPGLLRKRYRPVNISLSLREYFADSWRMFPGKLDKKCGEIVKELRSIVPNDKPNAERFLQVCNMDIKSYKITLISDQMAVKGPNITGDTKDYFDSQSGFKNQMYDVHSKIDQFNHALENNAYDTVSLSEMFDFYRSLQNNTIYALLSDQAISILCLLLRQKDLGSHLKPKYIDAFVDYGYKIIKNEIVFKDANAFNILFEQLKTNLDKSTKNRIKKLILDLLFYDGQNGLVNSLTLVAANFLQENEDISHIFFNTILELAKDEMLNQIYNFRLIKQNDLDKDFSFEPNKQPHIDLTYLKIKGYDAIPYQKRCNQIIETFLYNESKLMLDSKFDLRNYDAPTLSRLFFCKYKLQNKLEYDIAKQFLFLLIELWAQEKHYYYEIVSFHEKRIFMHCLERIVVSDLDECEKLLSIMFDNVNFSLFNKETIDFYCEVFDVVPAHYFDAHGNRKKRDFYQKIYNGIDKKLTTIIDDGVRSDLSRILLMAKADSRRFGNDWRKCKTEYSYEDVLFLNDCFKKHGYLHLGTLFESIERLHLKELMPYIILSINESLEKSKKNINACGYYSENMTDEINAHAAFMNELISLSFFEFKGDIKEDGELIAAYENILKTLIELKNKQAAVFLYEFHTH